MSKRRFNTLMAMLTLAGVTGTAALAIALRALTYGG